VEFDGFFAYPGPATIGYSVMDIIMLVIGHLLEIGKLNCDFPQFSTHNAIMILAELCMLSRVCFGAKGAS
jgi:hypothetical protein